MTTITQVVPGIYATDHQVAEGKNAVVIGARGAIIVDTGTYPEEGEALAGFVRGQGYVPNRLLYTHGHGDHILGSAVFRDTPQQNIEVMAHALTPVEMRRLLPVLAARQDTTPDELSTRIAWPNLTFRDELLLDLGDKHLHIFPTPGHSQDGVSVYVEEDKLLIAGDAVVTGIVPAIGDGDSRTLERTLRRLQEWNIAVLIPGHGPVVHGREAVQDWLRWLPGYLQEIRNVVQGALDGGLPPEQVVEGVAYEKFVAGRLPEDRHNMPKRHRATVQKILEEELAQRQQL